MPRDKIYSRVTPIILQGQSQLSWDNPTTNLEHDEDLVKNEVFFLFYGDLSEAGNVPESILEYLWNPLAGVTGVQPGNTFLGGS